VLESGPELYVDVLGLKIIVLFKTHQKGGLSITNVSRRGPVSLVMSQ
jgi:hypothetical protein